MIEIMLNAFFDKISALALSRRLLEKDSYLFHQNDPVRSLFILEQGEIALTRHQPDGSLIVLQRATAHMVLAEASLYSDTYHCDAIAAVPTRVLELSKAVFLEQLKCDDALATQWAAHLAREVQSTRYRSEILSRRTVAERLDGWLTWQGGVLPSKGRWKSIAIQIGVSPEALYRELSKRRRIW